MFWMNLGGSRIRHKSELLRSNQSRSILIFPRKNLKNILTVTKLCFAIHRSVVIAMPNGLHFQSLLPENRTKILLQLKAVSWEFCIRSEADSLRDDIECRDMSISWTFWLFSQCQVSDRTKKNGFFCNCPPQVQSWWFRSWCKKWS